MEPEPLEVPVARHVWDTRYRAGAVEGSIASTWAHVASALAAVEPTAKAAWERRFRDILMDFRFLPGGRIQARAGTRRDVTLLNCFVMGPIEDSMPGIFCALEEGAVTMQRGGGVGYDFSTLRPAETPARSTGMIASGPVSFMNVWDAMCATIQSSGARRGAMMGTLRCDHPDIIAFADAKRHPDRLRHFNLSVLVTDHLVDALDHDAAWPLVFPASRLDGTGETLLRDWAGEPSPVPCRVVSRMPARAVWDKVLRASYDTGEAGVLFIDRINRLNNLAYCERINATNPCGEVPLPPYGSCDLGSINLARLVRDPFTPRARLDTWRLDELGPPRGASPRRRDRCLPLSPPRAAERSPAHATYRARRDRARRCAGHARLRLRQRRSAGFRNGDDARHHPRGLPPVRAACARERRFPRLPPHPQPAR